MREKCRKRNKTFFFFFLYGIEKKELSTKGCIQRGNVMRGDDSANHPFGIRNDFPF